jgi:hypothetical protein
LKLADIPYLVSCSINSKLTAEGSYVDKKICAIKKLFFLWVDGRNVRMNASTRTSPEEQHIINGIRNGRD